MLPSLRDMANRLSKLEREFLVDHVDGFRIFADHHIENRTRAALIARKLIRYDPVTQSKLGCPRGTAITDTGREVLGYILGNEADNVMRGLLARDRYIDEHREELLLRALHESARRYAIHQDAFREGDK